MHQFNIAVYGCRGTLGKARGHWGLFTCSGAPSASKTAHPPSSSSLERLYRILREDGSNNNRKRESAGNIVTEAVGCTLTQCYCSSLDEQKLVCIHRPPPSSSSEDHPSLKTFSVSPPPPSSPQH